MFTKFSELSRSSQVLKIRTRTSSTKNGTKKVNSYNQRRYHSNGIFVFLQIFSRNISRGELLKLSYRYRGRYLWTLSNCAEHSVQCKKQCFATNFPGPEVWDCLQAFYYVVADGPREVVTSQLTSPRDFQARWKQWGGGWFQNMGNGNGGVPSNGQKVPANTDKLGDAAVWNPILYWFIDLKHTHFEYLEFIDPHIFLFCHWSIVFDSLYEQKKIRLNVHAMKVFSRLSKSYFDYFIRDFCGVF